MMPIHRILSCVALMAATSVSAAEPNWETTVAIDGKPVLPTHGTVAGFWLFAEDEGAQLALMGHPPRSAVAALDKGRRITMRVAVAPGGSQGKPLVDTQLIGRSAADVAARVAAKGGKATLVIDVSAPNGATAVQLDAPRIVEGDNVVAVAMNPRQRAFPQPDAVGCSPPLRPAIEQKR